MPTAELKEIRQRVRIKRDMGLADYFGLIFLTRKYYDAMADGTTLPEKPLPELQYLIDANTIVRAYLENCPQNMSLKLCRAILSVEQVVAVWLFYNEPDLNIRLGNYQLLALNHKP